MTSNILAIDPATTTGWALLYDDELSSGLIGLGLLKPHEGPGHRFFRLERELQDMFGYIGQLTVVCERPFGNFKNIEASVGIVGLYLHVKAWANRHKFPFTAYSANTIKKHATGNGHAPKPLMLSAARKKFRSQHIVDDNQADALWLLDYQIYGER